MQETKRDIEKQVAAAERPARNNFGTLQLKYETASRLIVRGESPRAQQRKGMPLPVFDESELAKMSAIANRTKDAKLLEFVYKGALETLIRHFTDSPEKKHERLNLVSVGATDVAIAQTLADE